MVMFIDLILVTLVMTTLYFGHFTYDYGSLKNECVLTVLLQGSLEEFLSLVEAIKNVDVVISAIGGGASQMQVLDSCMESFLLQHNIIKAIKQVGTIKAWNISIFKKCYDKYL